MAIFFVGMAMLTANLRHSHQFRAQLHNGFWMWKFLLIAGLFIGLYVGIAFNGTSETFLEIWKWIALIFGTLFIFWQMTVFINFAYEWGKSWAQAAERSSSKTGMLLQYDIGRNHTKQKSILMFGQRRRQQNIIYKFRHMLLVLHHLVFFIYFNFGYNRRLRRLVLWVHSKSIRSGVWSM